MSVASKADLACRRMSHPFILFYFILFDSALTVSAGWLRECPVPSAGYVLRRAGRCFEASLGNDVRGTPVHLRELTPHHPLEESYSSAIAKTFFSTIIFFRFLQTQLTVIPPQKGLRFNVISRLKNLIKKVSRLVSGPAVGKVVFIFFLSSSFSRRKL